MYAKHQELMGAKTVTSKKPELLEMRYKEVGEHLAEETGPIGCGGEAGSHQLEKREQIISSKEQEEQRKGGLKILACLRKGENLFVPEEWWEAKLKQRTTHSLLESLGSILLEMGIQWSF